MSKRVDERRQVVTGSEQFGGRGERVLKCGWMKCDVAVGKLSAMRFGNCGYGATIVRERRGGTECRGAGPARGT
jgi:hypothetical protein